MKDIFKIIAYIISIIFITLIICIFFIKPNQLNFKELSEFKYIDNNRLNGN